MAGSKIKEVTVSVGMSIDKKGVWIKAGTSIKIEVSDGDGADSEARSALFERAFEIASVEIDKELTRLGVEA